MQRQKKATSTSSFGSVGHVNHDSSKFYSRGLYSHLPKESNEQYKESKIDDRYLDTILLKSCEDMCELPDNSVHLMVTSPPYNVGKEYDSDLSLSDYLRFLRKVWNETFRVLVPGGRACINVANLGRKPYIPLHALITSDMLDIGFLMRGEIIWNKSASAGSSTAWGSWLSPTNPTLRDVHEYILVFSKSSFSRKNIYNRKSTITKEEFLTYTKSVWTFPTVSAKEIGHPAPFPIELPYRLIQLYTFEGEIILDPFMGSGQTAIAAKETGRYFIGYEINKKYVELANRRLSGLNSLFDTP